METAIKTIIDAIKANDVDLDAAWLDKLVRSRNRASHDATRRVAKKRLLPYYRSVKANDPDRWASWGVDAACEEQLVRLLKTKPRRTASGVATITVITKPWPCSSDCLYCPNDVRMPKSYLADEPACQRAERNFFDPYLQVVSRLRALDSMGHVTDKVELIVLGGTWSDYSEEYQIWFISELFRALNDAGSACDGVAAMPQGTGSSLDAAAHGLLPLANAHDGGLASDTRSDPSAEGARAEAGRADASDADRPACEDDPLARERRYRACGISCSREELEARTGCLQAGVNEGVLTYNQAISDFYKGEAWRDASSFQRATLDDLDVQHRANEGAAHRVVGLVIETRPDLITPESLTLMRRLGCTKVQMGVQSLDERVLAANRRNVSVDQISRAFSLLRLFGFKTHVHFMVNLLGATPEGDKRDYARLVNDPAFLPDEVKLYPCCLVESAHLKDRFEDGSWRPYAEDVLVDVLEADTLATPPYARISRMIRDISSGDIVAGNKKTNLRQMVEGSLERKGAPVREIRHREIAGTEVALDELSLDCVAYETAVGEERFLQWVTPAGSIAGFLRLSLPHAESLEEGVPVRAGEAMIREVHVYGKVARLHEAGEGAQHAGLGKRLVEEACAQAREAGYSAINVISSVGTRIYYRGLGFDDNGLYQRKSLAYNTDA